MWPGERQKTVFTVGYVREVAELASREVPDKLRSNSNENDSVFFLQAGDDGTLKLWVGSGDGLPNLAAIRARKFISDVPYDLNVQRIQTSISSGIRATR